MLLALVTIFIGGLVGNLHCAGMCGAFVAFALRLHDPSQQKRRTWLLMTYNVGRLVTYAAMGAFAGFMGSALEKAGTLAGLSQAAAILAALLMIVFSLATLARLAGFKLTRLPTPAALHKILAAGHERAAALPPMMHAFATGLLTTLLPCGLLYFWVAVAAGTASMWQGAVVMTAFWLGTLPALVALGLTLHKLTGPLARRLPLITASAVLVMGLYTLAVRVQAAPALPKVGGTLMQQAEAGKSAEPACCAAKKGATP